MSKVICDVCGTTYPETVTQCPICGSAKNATQQTAAGENQTADTSGYAYVKGGRFSKKNVKRRNSRTATSSAAQRRTSGSSRSVQESNEPNNTGLVIVAILLVLAILSVLAYILIVHNPGRTNNDDTNPGGSTPAVSQTDRPEPTQSIPAEIPCTSLQLSNDVLELAVGETWTLVAKTEPVDHTDALSFVSADPAIATVDENGLITVLAEGETQITVTCGQMSAVCTVRTPEDVPVVGVFEFAWNTRYTDDKGNGDTTLTAYGATWKAYRSDLSISVADITWTTDDPTIAVIENGVVKAVGPGRTYVHATYNGVTYTCVIRCAFEMPEVIPTCTISHTDVTISVGESFTLKLRDAEGASLNVTWLCDSDSVTIDGNKITGAVAGTNCKVYVEYEGCTYSCTVYVRPEN